tara:strand:- start:1914 stop:2426 length:513 start_codon:yes stop_codon:yes gene_type:complete
MLSLTFTDCTIEGLLTTGVFSQISATEIINKATVEVLTSCCSDVVINTFEIDVSNSNSTYYSITDDKIILKPEAFFQTEEISEGLYSIRIILDVNVDTVLTLDYLSYTICHLVEGTLKCIIAKVIVDDIYNTELVPMYNSIKVAIECNDCCTACKLYTYLIEKLNECPDC